ncbi:MAG: 23S rRNA (adenine(2503)-C(2))-methyltransferase RlmN [Chitinophagales bacterium]|nr:23S rRNA (adenine(2503)-C(2))-methyltransferase RlmN [Chitinophagales bacterium]
MSTQQDIRLLSKEEIETRLSALGEPKFRAKQVLEWLWKKGALSFDEMTNLSKPLREKLSTEFVFNPVLEDVVQKSNDGTVKLAMHLHDNRIIEGVMIPEDDRATACVSSQVGCTLSCSFCATGFLKRERNLSTAEIYDQVTLLNRHAARSNNGRGLTNIVYMGMGEPLLNYDNVMQSIRILTSPDGLNMAAKRITVSTSGIERGIRKMADEGVKFNLAFSLHAPTNEKREKIMDINRSNKLEDVIAALNYFYQKTGNKITFEYILFDHFNDSLEDAENLAKLYKQVPAFINLIDYNNVEGVTLKRAKPERRDAFLNYLKNKNIEAKVRRSRGDDIDAACGQLANKH